MENINSFNITANAAKRINYLKENEQPGARFRISVEGGGCAGFKYNFSFDVIKNEYDIIFISNGAEVIIDDLSLKNFMNGASLDFIEELGGSYFTIINPNSSSSCGCGNSFDLK